jgi:uncharacterized delta-60 repeat protein
MSLLLAVVLVSALVGALAPTAHAAIITEFAIPSPDSLPTGITLGPDGNLWFTEPGAFKIGKITPLGTVTEFSTPPARAITSGPDGNLWFTMTDFIGKITPEGAASTFEIPTSGANPIDITAGPDGNLWFTEVGADQIGKITPAGIISEYPIAGTDYAAPWAITAGPDGNLWFTTQREGIGRITPDGTITLFPYPGGRGFLGGIATGPDENLWFTYQDSSPPHIGRITTSGSITLFPLASESFPNDIASGPDGSLWFTEPSRNRIGRITTTGVVSTFTLPTRNSYPWGITAGPDEALWFTENGTNKIGRIQPEPGDVDTRFTTNFTSGFDGAYGVAIQPADGKIVVAGEAAGSGGRFALARYNTDGTLDPTFSGDGKVTTNFTSRFDGAFDMAIQPVDGKIVAVGTADNGRLFALARYNTDGSLDPDFSEDGKVTTNISSGSDFAFGVAIQPVDGKIVVAGEAAGSGGRFALARYNSDGTLDPTFSGDGKVTTNFTAGDDRADLIAIQPTDGKIVAAGTANYFSSSARFALVRYDTDGALDTTFSSDGKVTTNFTSGFDGAFAVAIQPVDGKIVAAGQAGGGSAGKLALARYNTDGALDSNFSADGKVTTDFTTGLDYADDIAIQEADGKIVAVGAANFFGPDSKFALARYNTDGTLDATFSGDGKVTTNFTSGLDGAFGVAIQPVDGKIVAAGRAGGSGGRFAAARYLAG